MMEDKGGLDETGEAGCGLRVAPVGFRRSDKQRATGRTFMSRDGCDCFQFNGIAYPRARTVGFDIPNPRGGILASS